MAESYSARGWEIPPLPWTNLSPPFSGASGGLGPMRFLAMLALYVIVVATKRRRRGFVKLT